jgi:hypothetical protein
MNTTAIAVAVSLAIGAAAGSAATTFALSWSATIAPTGPVAAACPEPAATLICPVAPKAAETEHFFKYQPTVTTGSKGF